MATPTPSAAATAHITQMESELDTHRSQALSSLIRVGHVNPSVAHALASIYRAALTGDSFIKRQAATNRVDTMWLYFVYSAAAFVALGAAEMGMNFGA
ncbi:MAG: hypothetical protein Q9216_007205, partial [Gyalolechia sp. 2 TL-2023]